ncbi:MAG TPA: HD domain-containing protein [bacterium]|nr:HD domain-containing protein [bacterium]HPN44990.1 HD domain-containing protein [bacterium]
MVRKDFFKIQTWFFEYVNGFTSDDQFIRQNYTLKKEHTLRVCDNILTIAGELSFTSDELPVAEICALLHDIGRFEQFQQYRTFMDAKSVNHAELGLEIISRYRVLDDIDPVEKAQIRNAVAWHNRAALPDSQDARSIVLAKMLRDADKLDIWKVVTDYFNAKNKIKNEAIEFSLPDTPGFTPAIYADLFKNGIVKTAHLQNLNDFKLLLVGWVFDLNYNISLQLLKERGYLDAIRSVLPQNEEINRLFIHVNDYINERLN